MLKAQSTAPERKKSAGDSHILQRQGSSRLGVKEPSFNEFSFKNSMDSSRDKEKESTSPQSSRHINESAVNESNRKNINDSATGVGALGIHRTATPNFTNRPSGFLLEKKNSAKNINGKAQPAAGLANSLIGSVIPQDLKSDPHERLSFGGPQALGLSSSIQEKSQQIAAAEARKNEGKVLTFSKPQSDKFSNPGSKNSVGEEHVQGDNTANYEKKTSTEMMTSSQKKGRAAQLSITQTNLITYDGKSNQAIEVKHDSIGNLNEEHTNSNIVKNGWGKVLESQGSLELNSMSLVKSNPVKDISTQETYNTLKKEISPKGILGENSTEKLFVAKTNSMSPQTSEGKNDLHHPVAGSTKAFFNNTAKLSANDKFKRNLLDVVKDVEDDISPIISAQKRPISKMPKQLEVQQQKIESKENKKTGLNKEIPEIQSNSSGATSNKNEMLKEKPVEQQQQQQQVNPVVQKDSQKELNHIERPKPPAVGRVNRNLLNLMKEEVEGKSSIQQAETTKNQKLNRLDSVDILGTHKPNLLPMSSNNYDQESRSNILPSYNHLTQTQNNLGISVLEEAQNKSIYNFADNISAADISKYEFVVVENLDYEMEEGKSMIRSPLLSGEKFLAGLNSPSQVQQKQKPDFDRKDSGWQGRMNLLKMANSQKDSGTNSNTNSNTVSRKGSLSSAGPNIFRDRVNSLPVDAQMAMLAGREMSDDSMDSLNNSRKIPLQHVESNKHKPKTPSHFQLGSDGTTETVNSVGETPKQDAEKPRRTSLRVEIPGKALLQKSTSAILPSGGGIQEADSKFEQSNVTKGEVEDQQRGRPGFVKSATESKHLLTPPPSQTDLDKQNASKKTLQRLASENQDGSRSPNLKGAVLKRTHTSVIETNKLDKTRDDEGQKKINQYLFIKDLGK